jgi:hypothetical protein
MISPARGWTAWLLLILAAGPALAQTDAPATPPAQAGPSRRALTRLEHTIADLHRRLHITAAEQPQWDVFTQILRDNAEHMDALYEARSTAETMSAVDDLRSNAGIAEARAQDMRRLVPAFETLYDAMPPEQRRLADAAFKEFEVRIRRAPHD